MSARDVANRVVSFSDMSCKESSKQCNKSIAGKKSMPSLERTDREKQQQTSRRKLRRLPRCPIPSFSALSRGLDADPPGFPPLDLIPFDNEGQGDSSAIVSKSEEFISAPRPEFKMIREDFPALPGTQGETIEFGYQLGGGESSSTQPSSQRNGIRASPDGRISNIPNSMLHDQYGIAGLLSFLRAAEHDKTLEILGLGEDLTQFGFDLNTKDRLYPTFSGPFAEFSAQPHDVDYDVPKEYLHCRKTKKKLPALDFSRYSDDTLFYLFYTFVGDYKQLMAAAYLYDKEWRFHMEEHYWMSLIIDHTNSYCFFDPRKWCKVRVVNYSVDIHKLAARPQVPNVSPPKPEAPPPATPTLQVPVMHPVPLIPVNPYGSRYPILQFAPRHNIPTVFTPCPTIIGTMQRSSIPVMPSRAVPVMTRYQYAPPRNITTLYAPAMIHPDARRKKRY